MSKQTNLIFRLRCGYKKKQNYTANIFEHKRISNNEPILWSGRLPDLSSMDSFLWEYLRKNVLSVSTRIKKKCNHKIRQSIRELDYKIIRSVNANELT